MKLSEDAIAAYDGSERQLVILELTVESALRSNELSTLRYTEGLSSYERVLDSQRALFNHQLRLIDSRSTSVRSLITLYKALGAGWQGRTGLPEIDDANIQQMQERTNWGDLFEAVTGIPDDAGIRSDEDPAN